MRKLLYVLCPYCFTKMILKKDTSKPKNAPEYDFFCPECCSYTLDDAKIDVIMQGLSRQAIERSKQQ